MIHHEYTCVTYLHTDMHTQICDVGSRKTIAHFNLLKRFTGNLSFVDYASFENTVRRMSGKFIF